MNRFRRIVPGLVLGLTLSVTSVGFAQSMSQANADDKKETCCCVASGCCGDSCPMKHGEKKNHAGTSDKHECSCGDSCSMMKDGAMKEGAMKMATSDKHACCCEGDSCAMMKDGAMNHDAMKQGAAAKGKHEGCCCSGDSCNMKDKKEMKSKS
jgi:hypothetical protein